MIAGARGVRQGVRVLFQTPNLALPLVGAGILAAVVAWSRRRDAPTSALVFGLTLAGATFVGVAVSVGVRARWYGSRYMSVWCLFSGFVIFVGWTGSWFRQARAGRNTEPGLVAGELWDRADSGD